jgi:hypothetical protein
MTLEITFKKKLALALVLVALVLAHVGYWYWPRERSSALDPQSLAGRAFRTGGYDACVWIPYPHQNLGAFTGSLPDGRAFLEAAARLGGARAPRFPGFGPFAVPPAHEVTVCADQRGGRLFLAARVYPALRIVARLAGKLAGNPWLSGGEVRQPSGDPAARQERAFRVAWEDGVWTVRSGAAPDGTSAPVAIAEAAGTSSAPTPVAEAAGTSSPSLGLARLQRDLPPLPAGEYRLARAGANLELALAGGATPPDPPPALERAAPVFLAIGGPDWPDGAERPLPPAAFVLYDVAGGLQLGPLGSMPGAALFHPPDRPRWKLPTGGLGKLLTDNLPQGSAAGWDLLAFDDGSLARAKDLAPVLSGFVPPDGGEATGGLTLGLWIRPRPALALVRQIRRGLEKVPLVAEDEIDPWRDAEVLLDAFEGYQRISLVATRAPAGFRLRLEK